MSRLDDISRALIARLDERQDAEVSSLNGAYDAALNHTITRAGELMPRGPDGRLVPDPGALARLRGAFERFGDDAPGYLLEEHVERVALSLERVADTLDAGFAQLGEDPLSTDALALSVLARATWLDRLGELGRYHRAQVRDAVMRQALGRMDGASLRREMRELSGRSRGQSDRLHHDALIGYSRSVQAEKAEALGFEYFEYFGPVDTVTRDFCRARAGRVYTRDEIDRMDNGHSPDVMQTGGGHRCRHHWRPVRRDWFSNEEWEEMRPVLARPAMFIIDSDEVEQKRAQRSGWDEDFSSRGVTPDADDFIRLFRDPRFDGAEFEDVFRAGAQMLEDGDVQLLVLPDQEFDRRARAMGALQEPDRAGGFHHRGEIYIREGEVDATIVAHELLHAHAYRNRFSLRSFVAAILDATGEIPRTSARQQLYELLLDEEFNAHLMENEARVIMGLDPIFGSSTDDLEQERYVSEHYDDFFDEVIEDLIKAEEQRRGSNP